MGRTKNPNKNRTKNRNSRLVLRTLDVDILFCVAMGANTNKQLHAKLRKRKQKKIPKSTISDHTTKLQKLGLLVPRRLFNIKEFYLTDHGKLAISKIMTRGQGQVLGLPVRGHAFGFICEIVRAPKSLWDRVVEENWVAFYPKNRVAFKKRLMGCMVIFNPRSVQFMPPEVYGPSQDAAFEEALRLVLRVKDFLEKEEFEGLVLGTPQKVLRVTGQHYARPFDPLAVEYYKDSLKTGVRTTYRSDRLAIDMSPGVPETETVHRVFAKEDIAKITRFYESMVRGKLTWEDLEALRFEIPQHLGEVMQQLDVLDKGHMAQDRVMSQLASGIVMMAGEIRNLVKTLKRPKPKKTRRRRRKVPQHLHHKADQKADEIRRKVEKTLARLEKYDVE